MVFIFDLWHILQVERIKKKCLITQSKFTLISKWVLHVFRNANNIFLMITIITFEFYIQIYMLIFMHQNPNTAKQRLKLMYVEIQAWGCCDELHCSVPNTLMEQLAFITSRIFNCEIPLFFDFSLITVPHIYFIHTDSISYNSAMCIVYFQHNLHIYQTTDGYQFTSQSGKVTYNVECQRSLLMSKVIIIKSCFTWN